MKNLLLAVFLVGACAISGFSQEQNFLNSTVCGDQDIDIDGFYNTYVQGGGHNYYLSYTPAAHRGSFSEHRFPVGTDDNPLVIFVDSSDTENVKKFYYKGNYNELYTGTDFGDAYISRGRWPGYNEEEDALVGEDLPYEKYAFQCILNKKAEEIKK